MARAASRSIDSLSGPVTPNEINSFITYVQSQTPPLPTPKKLAASGAAFASKSSMAPRPACPTPQRTSALAAAIAQARSRKTQKRLLGKLLEVIARDQLPERFGRYEPRAVQGRPKPFPLLNPPRWGVVEW